MTRLRRMLAGFIVFGFLLSFAARLYVMAIDRNIKGPTEGFNSFDLWMATWSAVPFAVLSAIASWQLGTSSRWRWGLWLIGLPVVTFLIYEWPWLPLAACGGAALASDALRQRDRT